MLGSEERAWPLRSPVSHTVRLRTRSMPLQLLVVCCSICVEVSHSHAPQPVQVTTRSSSQLPLAQPISNWPTSTTATTPLIEWRQTSSANCPAGRRSSVGDGHGVSSPPAAATSARQEPSLSLPCAGSTHRAPWRRRHFTSGMLRVGESTGFS